MGGLFSWLVRQGLPLVPKPLVGRVARRYVAGETLEQALETVGALAGEGAMATLDLLGEEVTEPSRAVACVEEYERMLTAIAARGLPSNVSIKPTGLGLKIGEAVCRENVERIVAAAHRHGNFVRIDMEDASTTDFTLDLYRELHPRYGNVGAVLQAYMRRTLADVDRLPAQGANVRLCKGIYIEPESIQFRDDQEVRVSFVRSLEALLDGGCYAAIATHDEWLVDESLRLVRERGLTPDLYEFQMLLGVRPELGDRIVADGHRLRIYVPYGQQWYEYSLRRLQENPKIAGYIAGDLGRSLLGR